MGKKWAVCIGINDYGGNMVELDFAKRDAELMQEWFKRAEFNKVYLFTDDSPRIDDGSRPYSSRPTGNTLKRFFRVRFKPDSLKIEDSIWFFFSGHGIRHEGKDYLMPCDGDPHPEGIEETAIPIGEITERLRESGAGDVVIMYDACRNKSKAGVAGFGGEKIRGVITLASCSPNERSYEIEDPKIQQGTFTYALIEALESTQQGRENYATFDRLYQRLRYRVPEINKQYQKNPKEQNPSGYVDPDQKRYSILLPKRATTQDIEIYKKQALNAEVDNNLWEAERLLTRLWEICPGDPEVRQYYNRVIIKKDRQEIARPTPTPQPEDIAGAKIAAARVEEPRAETKSGNEEAAEKRSKVTESVADSQPIMEDESKLRDFEFEVVKVDDEGQEVKREKGQAQYFTEHLGHGIGLDMVYIPGGEFMMGSPEAEGNEEEKPQHKVAVKPFFMGKFQIAQKQWRAIASLPKIKRDLKLDPSHFKGNDLPVEQVSWEDAVEFCQRLSKQTGKDYRLPTEAEWEYACRAGTTPPFHFGERITEKLANFGNNNRKTTLVGIFHPNAFGLYDMHGNVGEWCQDNWHDNYDGSPVDGSAWTSGSNSSRKVIRGGSWIVYSANCRSAHRFNDICDDRVSRFGLRVVCVEPVADSKPIIKNKSLPLQVFEFQVVNDKYKGQEVKPEKGKAEYFTENLGNGVKLEMVYIPGGEFMMGSPEREGYDKEKPQNRVKVQPFFMGKFQVTQAQWRLIASLSKSNLDLANLNLNPDSSHFKGDELPVEMVSWEEAEEFCRRLSNARGKEYRLPSEAEWEYACRAGTTTQFHFGETITEKLANFGNNNSKTTSVGSFDPNAFGLYDMHGNVWEWCQDDWYKNYKDAPTDGSKRTSGNSNKKVRRGGAWNNNSSYCRSASRDYYTSNDRNYNIGFRVVCVALGTT